MLGGVELRHPSSSSSRSMRSIRALGAAVGRRRPASRACGRARPPTARRRPARPSAPRATAALHRRVGGPDRPEHRELLARVAVGVVLVERRLLEEVLAQQPPGAEHDALGRRRACRRRASWTTSSSCASRWSSSRAQARCSSQSAATSRPNQLGEVVERVAAVPVDRGEVPRAGQRRVERPERAREPQRVLGDRLGEVAAGR